ncbi:unnamed protein product [marine sediment metagenome]|uniref:Uncharacterized protein n=1 Tax=marine sediment metagenome TaxID=412755 RepID=X1ETG6_9ZZZZ
MVSHPRHHLYKYMVDTGHWFWTSLSFSHPSKGEKIIRYGTTWRGEHIEAETE